MLRPLSLLELYELSRSLLAPPIYGNVTEFLLLSAPSPFKPSRFIDSLKCALPLLCAQYPALLATISEPHSKQPYWTWLEHVQWDEVIVEKRLRNLEQSTVEKVMGVECDTAIDPTQGKVLWRFIVGYEELADDSSKTCPSFLLGLVFNHCPMDGTAAMHVLVDLYHKPVYSISPYDRSHSIQPGRPRQNLEQSSDTLIPPTDALPPIRSPPHHPPRTLRKSYSNNSNIPQSSPTPSPNIPKTNVLGRHNTRNTHKTRHSPQNARPPPSPIAYLN